MRHHLLIFLYGAILLLPFLDNGTVLSRHEVLAAEPAREMLETNAPWAVQSFAGEFRTAKPPTMSWLIAGCMWLFDSRSEFVCRLPAALAGLITAHAIAIIATRLMNPRAGLLAGLITLTTYWLQMQARLSEADMPLTAAVTLAMLALLPLPVLRGRVGVGVSATTDSAEGSAGDGAVNRTLQEAHPPTKDSLGRSLLFYGATGVGFLLKGIAPLVTLPAAIAYWLWTRDRRTRRVLLNPFGILLFLLLLVAWPLAAYWTYPGILADWKMQTIDRTTGGMDGHEKATLLSYLTNLPFYFWTIPWILLPATPAFVIGAWAARNRWETSPAVRFCVAWAAPFLIIASLSAFKHKHYILPILPAFSIAAAYGTQVWWRSLKSEELGKRLLTGWFVGVAIVMLIVQWKVLPKFDSYRPHAELAWKAPPGPITLIGLGEAHIAYYLPVIPTRIDDPTKVTAPLTAVTTRKIAEDLHAKYQITILNEQSKLRGGEKETDRLVIIDIK